MRRALFALLAAFSGALILAGCATGTHVATGIRRPPIPPGVVQLYETASARYESVGLVTARTRGTGQASMTRATKKLKQQAGSLGANGIILNQVEHSGLAGRKLNLSGQAIYVQP